MISKTYSYKFIKANRNKFLINVYAEIFEGKYVFKCPKCGKLKRVSKMDIDLLKMGSSKEIKCIANCTKQKYYILLHV